MQSNILEDVKKEMSGREDYNERRQARIERLNAAADREKARGAEAYKRSHDLVKDIPLGQPNIEGRNALPRLREKSMKAFEKSMEHDRKAENYAARADAAENNAAISSDDPAAIDKLEEKIRKLEESKRAMKAVNAYYRKHKTLDGCAELTDGAKLAIEKNWEAGWYTGIPFPPYELTNINQRIKAAKTRIEKLRQVEAMPAEIITFSGGEIESDPVTNRVIIRFLDRQDDGVLCRLKANGFHWAPSITAWTRMRNREALAAALRICGAENDRDGENHG